MDVKYDGPPYSLIGRRPVPTSVTTVARAATCPLTEVIPASRNAFSRIGHSPATAAGSAPTARVTSLTVRPLWREGRPPDWREAGSSRSERLPVRSWAGSSAFEASARSCADDSSAAELSLEDLAEESAPRLSVDVVAGSSECWGWFAVSLTGSLTGSLASVADGECQATVDGSRGA